MTTLGNLLACIIHHRDIPHQHRRQLRRGAPRDGGYLAFVRRHACSACGTRFSIEAAHTGPHGLWTKASDYSAVPLCRWCHVWAPNSLHNRGPQMFQRFHRIRFHRIIRALHVEWAQRGQATNHQPPRQQP